MITSRDNPLFKKLKSILEPKHAKKHGQCLVSGRKIVAEILKLFPESELILEGEALSTLVSSQKPIRVQKALFKELDLFGTHAPLLLVNLPEIKAFEPAAPEGLELVVSLQDPANLGAVLRSAEAFFVQKVILLKECSFAFHPKAIRSSSGSAFRLKLFEGPSLNDFQDKNLICLDLEGEDIRSFQWPKSARLFLGEEGRGLPEHLKSVCKIHIPTAPTLDSLNATVAASIALYSYSLIGR